jgi:ABC-2 type transport system permease protein
MTVTRAEEIQTQSRRRQPSTAGRGRGGVRLVWWWELRKLAAQRRTALTAMVCLVAPLAAAFVLDAQASVPKDTLYGRWVHTSGFAVSLLLLGFAGQWLFPLLTSVVAGDIFASEDGHGTWKTVLTRSRSRGQIFVGKALAAATFSVLAVTLFALSSLAGGLLVVGRQPLVSLSGTLLPADRLMGLVLASWASTLLAVLAFTALGLLLSVAARNSVVGVGGPVVIGLLMSVLSLLGGVDLFRHLLLTEPFSAWHGLLSDPPFYGLLTRGALVSLGYLVACLGLAWVLFRRRDVTGG